MKFSITPAILLAVFTVDICDAHFTLVGSREQAKFGKLDNQRFWPIKGGNILRPVRDCLELPATKGKSVSAGTKMTLTFEVGGGASHVGMCKASLIDRQSGKVVNDLGSLKDCVAKGSAFPVEIPSNPGCTDCVIKTEVRATHIPVSPEDYDSCVDINVAGGTGNGGGGSGNGTGAQPTPTQSAAPSEPTIVLPGRGAQDKAPSLPVPGPSNPPASVNPPQTSSTPTNPPSPSNLPKKEPKALAPEAGSSCSFEDTGSVKCVNEQEYVICASGVFQTVKCPAGTSCSGAGTAFTCA
ncbi:hypothetical protein BKA69DRAFT_1040479 [Paraphysoderma sedebokerense]|nr:hypothetical protein BKA69DRAFT_1040479 [Paraphysoderma sedebokerense]